MMFRGMTENLGIWVGKKNRAADEYSSYDFFDGSSWKDCCQTNNCNEKDCNDNSKLYNFFTIYFHSRTVWASGLSWCLIT